MAEENEGEMPPADGVAVPANDTPAPDAPKAPKDPPNPDDAVTAEQYLDEVRLDTWGTDEEKVQEWLKNDKTCHTRQARDTAERVLLGMAMLKEYGKPDHNDKLARRREVAAKYGMKVRHAFTYMGAARAVENALALQISDADGQPSKDARPLTKRAFDRPIVKVQAFVEAWENGVDMDERDEVIAGGEIVVKRVKKDPKESETKPPKLATWLSQAKKLLVNLPEGEPEKVANAVATLKEDASLKLTVMADGPVLRREDSIVKELDVLVERAKRCAQPDNVMGDLILRLMKARAAMLDEERAQRRKAAQALVVATMKLGEQTVRFDATNAPDINGLCSAEWLGGRAYRITRNLVTVLGLNATELFGPLKSTPLEKPPEPPEGRKLGTCSYTDGKLTMWNTYALDSFGFKLIGSDWTHTPELPDGVTEDEWRKNHMRKTPVELERELTPQETEKQELERVIGEDRS